MYRLTIMGTSKGAPAGECRCRHAARFSVMDEIYFVSELLTFGIFAVLGLSARRWDDAMGRRVRTVSAAACGISLPMALVSLFCLLARPAWGRTLHRAAFAVCILGALLWLARDRKKRR